MLDAPEIVLNYLKHKLQARIFGNHTGKPLNIGMISRLTGLPFSVTKGIFGSGNAEFIKALVRIMEFKYFKTSNYNDLVISIRNPSSFGSFPVLKGDETYYFTPLIHDIVKAKLRYNSINLGFNVFTDATGKRFLEMFAYQITDGNLAKPQIMRKMLYQGKYVQCLNYIHQMKYFIGQSSTYRYSNPVSFRELPIKHLRVNDGVIEKEINGIFLDLSRPFSSPEYKATLFDISSQWISNSLGNSNAGRYWSDAILNLETSDEVDGLRLYNEMVYFADKKSEIGAFIKPLWDILDDNSKQEIIRLATIHASDVSNQLKIACNTNLNKWPCNVAYSGNHPQGGEWYHKIKSGPELPSDFEFEINEDNALLWYLDFIMHNPNKQLDLKLINNASSIIQFLTLNPNRDTSFKLSEVVVHYRPQEYTKEILELIVKNQEAVVKYYAMLEKKARNIDKKSIDLIKKAFDNLIYWTGRNEIPFHDAKSLLTIHLSTHVIPPNIVRTPSGHLIPFPMTFEYRNNLPFIPMIMNEYEYSCLLEDLGLSTVSDLYMKIMDKKRDLVNNIETLVDETLSFMKMNLLDWIDEQEDFIKRFDKIDGNPSQITQQVKNLVKRFVELSKEKAPRGN